jgi:hypothetical protein
MVRPGRPEEIPEVLALWRAAGSVPGVSDDPASLGRLLETSGDALLVAQVEGRLAGTIIAGWDGWRGSLYRLAVLPPAAAASRSAWSPRPSGASPPRAPAASAPS